MKKLKLKSTKLVLRSETVARLHPRALARVQGGDTVAPAVVPASDSPRTMCSPHTPGATIMTCG